MNGYDSVFANVSEEDIEFDTMFDQEDNLIDTVVGCNENGDPLTGADPCPAKTAEERSCDDCDPNYEKDIDADDSKDAPKDAEGTVGYDFEEKPEVDKQDDQTEVDPKEVKPEEDPEYQKEKDSDKGVEDTVTGTIENEEDVLESYFKEAEEAENPEVVENDDKGVEDTVTGTIENEKDVLEAYFKEAEELIDNKDPEANAKERSCDDCDPDYEKDVDADDSKDAPKDAEGTVGYDFEEEPEVEKKDDQTEVDPKEVKVEEEVEYDITIPKDAEGTVGYEFEVNPEVGAKDDQTIVDSDEVKVEEETELDFEGIAPEGTEKTSPAGPTEVSDDGGDSEVEYDFEESAKEEIETVDKIDKDVENIETPDDYIEDDVIDDVDSKDPEVNLDYDISDEEVIDDVMKNK